MSLISKNIRFLILLSCIFIQACGGGTTTVGNPDSNKSKQKIAGVVLEKLNPDGSSNILIATDIFGSEEVLPDSKIEVRVNGQLRPEFSNLDLEDFYNSEREGLVIPITGLNENDFVEVLVTAPGKEEEIYEGNASTQESVTLVIIDRDGDGVEDDEDNCPDLANPAQRDFDRDGSGDRCDLDDDNDLVEDDEDNCPKASNPSQRDTDSNGLGNSCDLDDDSDGVLDTEDNCPSIQNPDQEDQDGDGLGNECDFIKLVSGAAHACLLREFDKKVICWGDENDTRWVPDLEEGQQFSDIDTYSNHSCALLEEEGPENGKVICWGRNRDGNQADPPNEPGRLNEDYIQVSVGSNHSCALKANGSIVCWGFNGSGQLDVPDPNEGFELVEAGNSNTCAIKSEGGRVLCWGSDFFRIPFVPNNRNRPNQGYHDLSVGFYHACGIRGDNKEIVCWGDNYYRAIDHPSNETNQAYKDVQVNNHYTCALKEISGRILCWGSSENNYLDFDVVEDKDFINRDFEKFSLNRNHLCAMKNDGRLFCWQAHEDSNVLSVIDNLREPNLNYDLILTEFSKGCGLKNSGLVNCWGQAVGYGEFLFPDSLKEITFSSIAISKSSACGVRQEGGRIDCWGYEHGLDIEPAQSPNDELNPNSGFKEICGSLNGFYCALREDEGSVECFDKSGFMNFEHPNNIPNENYETVSCAAFHVCAIKKISERNDSGQIVCWGANDRGQADPGDENNNYIKISSEYDHNCAIKAPDNHIFCWGGNNVFGELNPPAPNEGFIAVSVKDRTSCAVKGNDGSIVCWGEGHLGQASPPEPNVGYKDVFMGTSGDYACGIKASDGRVVCWGFPGDGIDFVPLFWD